MEQIGTVSVDAGLIWVGDPCYIMGDDASSRVSNWSEFVDLLGGDASEPLGDGTGMAIQTLHGDGSYPVYAEKDRNGGISKIMIDFDPV